ncbi:DSD1 family PLP-dependent enzyme [Nocardia vulneris]|uniref:DSD1 family PLP-dependent enzyme n=1 Tax=Nocardia vulneris TaxID=1141657 RepID=UPI0030CACB00
MTTQHKWAPGEVTVPVVRTALELIGRPGSRRMIPTPAAVIDLAALRRNLSRAAQLCSDSGVALRPHAKTHKSADLARLQLDSGAVGVCVAKTGEAEALFAAGITDLLITSPIIDHHVAARVADLAAQGASVRVTVDHLDGVVALAAAARTPIDVLIDVDVNMHRTGVPDPEAALELAAPIQASPNLRLRGVQGYGGHWQHVREPDARRAAVADGMELLTATIDALDKAGFDTGIRTGGGTGTLDADLALGVLNELQPGSYAVLDRQYGEVESTWLRSLEQALFVQATVINTAQPQWVTVDAGLKAFATDADVPGTDLGTYVWYGDEHGVLVVGEQERPPLGSRVEFVPPHCDPTIDRYDFIHVVDNDVLVDLWPVHARGRSQ